MRVLIVDDNDQNLYMLNIILKGDGYDVDQARNGREALDIAVANPPDLIVSDIMMPVMDGFSLCYEWRKKEQLKDIPFVFYTATYTDEKDEELAYKAGADKFIRKPMETVEFMNVINEMVENIDKIKERPQRQTVEPEKDHEEFHKLYDARLISKLEKKIDDYKRENEERKRAEIRNAELLKLLEEKNKELEQIIYVTSHDLRSPLVNLQGYSTELISACNELKVQLSDIQVDAKKRIEIDRIINEEILQDLDYIQDNTDKMNELQNGVLRISRIGQAKLHPSIIDMNKLIQRIISKQSEIVKGNNIDIVTENLQSCIADKTLVCEVFKSLIDNAIQYLSPDRAGVIRISSHSEEGQAIYCVEDNGVGINQDYHKKIFELFHRLDPNGATEGKGIGLTIAHRIVLMHNASMWLESEPGVGSKFYVSLPCA